MPTPPPPLPIAKATPPPPTPSPTPGKVVLHTKMLRSFLDVTGLRETREAPKNAAFESDRNSQAASELPASGSLPLPSQKGKKRPFAEFANIDYALGKARQAPMNNQGSETLPDLSQPKIKEPQDPGPDLPEPLAIPTPTPQNAFAFSRPTPVPSKAAPAALPRTVVKPAQAIPMPQRLEMPKPGYQPQKEATKIEGAITNRGKAGVAAVGTPLGRYKKAISDAVGSRWYYYIHQRSDLITVGTVRITFYVNEKGRVEDALIASNTANNTFASVCMQSVTEAQIPLPPPDVLPSLNGGRLETGFTFVLYPE